MSEATYYVDAFEGGKHRPLFHSTDAAEAMARADREADLPGAPRITVTGSAGGHAVLTVHDWKAARAMMRRGEMNPLPDPTRNP